jgi:hypothetical protein
MGWGMGEHDDDLDSEVHEDAEQETDAYPSTGDDFDDPDVDDAGRDEDLPLNDDETEL